MKHFKFNSYYGVDDLLHFFTITGNYGCRETIDLVFFLFLE